MTNKLDKQDRGVSLGEQRRNRAYYKEFGPAMAAYVVAVILGTTIGRDTPTKKVFFVVATFIPVLLGGLAIIRHIRRVDEFERLVTYQALAHSFGSAMVTSIFLALLTSADIHLPVQMVAWSPFIAGMTTWGFLSIRHSTGR
jgi:hypothetical protein